MRSIPKIVIIDKDMFRGSSTIQLVQFVQNHFLILSEVLLYECATDEDSHQELLKRFKTVMLAGAYTCPNSWRIINREAYTLQPYGFLADLNETSRIRSEFEKYRNVSISDSIGHIYQEATNSARTLLDLAKSASTAIASKIPEVDRKARKLEGNKSYRFQLWLDNAQNYGIHKLAIEKAGHLTRLPDKYCLSEKWVTWQYFRLISALTFEYAFLRKGKGGNAELIRTEHDLQDIEYVLFLSRADGLLTKDRKLVKPLAKAAFPEKDVFSSLDEVPDEYLCHWD